MSNETTCLKCGNEQYTSDFDAQGHCSYCGYPKKAQPIHIDTMQTTLYNLRNQLAAAKANVKDRDQEIVELKEENGGLCDDVAAVTKERDTFESMLVQTTKSHSDVCAERDHATTLLREIEAWSLENGEPVHEQRGKEHNFACLDDCSKCSFDALVSRIPAEPAPCQEKGEK